MRLGACRRWKPGETIEEEYKSVTGVPKDKIKKTKAQPEQRLETDFKGNKEESCRYTSC